MICTFAIGSPAKQNNGLFNDCGMNWSYNCQEQDCQHATLRSIREPFHRRCGVPHRPVDIAYYFFPVFFGLQRRLIAFPIIALIRKPVQDGLERPGAYRHPKQAA
jgi:hypothetical protein